MSVSVANEAASLPIAYQLYLPQEWADDKARRRKAGVPEQIEFATRNHTALAQLPAARSEWGLRYAVAIQNKTTVWRD